MNSKAVGRWRQAFSRVELLTVTVVLLLLAGLLCMILLKRCRSSSRFACAFNLRQIGLAEFVFQNEHNGFPPWMLSKSRGGTLDYSDLRGSNFSTFSSSIKLHYGMDASHLSARHAQSCNKL